MKRTIVALVAVVGMWAPGAAGAKIDASCPAQSATAAIGGVVRNVADVAIDGVTVEISVAGGSAAAQPGVKTSGGGRYGICPTGGHNAYDVRVRDLRAAPEYATISQPYTTYANLADTDFTRASGHPLLYLTSLTVTPNEISLAPGVNSPSGAAEVTWLVRSKAPATTRMVLTLDHHKPTPTSPPPPMTLTHTGTEAGDPASGGWNLWAHTETVPPSSAEALHWAGLHGYDPVSGREVTQADRQPYVFDKTAPVFGFSSSTVCGPGVTANTFIPQAPTTNPQPIVTHGACDPYAGGSRSGLDPFTLTGRLCAGPYESDPCTDIHPALSSFTIVWLPSGPLARGDHWLRWSIADFAGNVAESPAMLLAITDRGGATPTLTGLQPANLGGGHMYGVVVGSGATTPTAYPIVGFRATDQDGQMDLVPGSLRVRIYHSSETTTFVGGTPVGGLIWEYDPFMGMREYDPVSKRGGAAFDLSSGGFRAESFSLQGKPPGRYIATASINDHGGNATSVTWHWLLAGAA